MLLQRLLHEAAAESAAATRITPAGPGAAAASLDAADLARVAAGTVRESELKKKKKKKKK